MSLTEALGLSQAGLNLYSRQISNASQNITNADVEGYTRKSLETEFVTTPTAIVPIRANIINNVDQFLLDAVVGDVTLLRRNQTVSDILNSLSVELGTTSGVNNFNNGFSDMSAAFEALSVNPESGASKVDLVSKAEEFSLQMRRYGRGIQEHRERVDQELETALRDVNRLLRELDDLNDKIVDRTGASDRDRALDLKDQRNVKLEELSGYIDIQYFETSEERLTIYAAGGGLLLGSVERQFNYSAIGIIDSNTVYPAGFNPINLTGADVTTQLTGGIVGGLIELRDTILVNEASKINEYTTQVMDAVNREMNRGTSVPAPQNLIGQRGFTAADPFALAGANGNFRIATVDPTGQVINSTDLNLAAFNTVGDFVAALNGLPGITAALDPNGSLTLNTIAGQGISMNELTGSVPPNNFGASHFFGLNNLFDGDRTLAENMRVKPEFSASADFIPTATFTGAAGPIAPGTQGASIGDNSATLATVAALKGPVNFNAVGGFTAQTTTLQNFGTTITGVLATEIDEANSRFESAEFSFIALKDRMLNSQGVNIDEELSDITRLENAYQASAQIISTVQELFDALINAVN